MAEVPTPQPAAPEAVAAEAIAISWDSADDPLDEARAVLAALREAGYTVARLEPVGEAFEALPGEWCIVNAAHRLLPLEHRTGWVPLWRVVGPVEPSP